MFSVASAASAIASLVLRTRAHSLPASPAPVANPSSLIVSRLLGSDPGLLRFHTALRSALGCLLTGAIAIGWAATTDRPPTLAAFAILFAMIAPLFLRDADRRGWFRSLATLYVTGTATFIVASALAPWPLVADAAFLAVLFAGMLCQACGARALGSALTALVGFYLGLYLHVSAAQTLVAVGLSVISLGMIVLACRVIVPTRPAVTLRRALQAVARCAAAVLKDDSASEPQAVRHLCALNEAALAVEEQLGLLDLPHGERLRASLIDVEVAAGQHAVANTRPARSDVRLRLALRRFSRASRDAIHSAVMSATALHRRQSEAGIVDRIMASRRLLSWLPALRATTAALIAMLIGHSLSPERWFWAVITSFVVFLGTRSRGDTMRKVGERVLGTLAGVGVSVVLVGLLHGEPWLFVAAMVGCVFGWAYFILTSYGRGVFFITVLIGLVYGELGFAMKPLIELRVGEVLVGCAVSMVVAVSMMPLRTSRHVDTKVAEVLGALDDVVRVSETTSSTMTPISAMRILDRRWHELRLALRPLQTRRVFAWNTRVELAVGPLFACVQAARELSGEAGAGRAGVNDARARLEGALALFNARAGRSGEAPHGAASRELSAAAQGV
jgi:hypothetical protein